MNETQRFAPPKPPTDSEKFLREIAPWILGKNISLYLTGRPKPITDCTVKHVGKTVIVARWNASTHLVPIAKVQYIRFGPDAEPVRDITHPLHTTMTTRMQYTHAPTPEQRKDSSPCQRSSPNQQRTADSETVTPAAIMPSVIAALASAAARSTASPPSRSGSNASE